MGIWHQLENTQGVQGASYCEKAEVEGTQKLECSEHIKPIPSAYWNVPSPLLQLLPPTNELGPNQKNTSPLTHSLPLSTPAVPMTPLLSETNAWTHSSRPISNKSKKSSALSPFTGPGGCHSGLACIISWVESPMSASVLGFTAGKGYCEEVWVCSGTSTQACYVKADSRANALEGRAPVSSFKPNG